MPKQEKWLEPSDVWQALERMEPIFIKNHLMHMLSWQRTKKMTNLFPMSWYMRQLIRQWQEERGQ